MKKSTDNSGQLTFDFDAPAGISPFEKNKNVASKIVQVTFGGRRNDPLNIFHNDDEAHFIEQIVSSARKLRW